jgi:hypothetical protein
MARPADAPADNAGWDTLAVLDLPTKVVHEVKALTRAEVAALASDLRAMMDRIEAGDLDATIAMRHRIEGAIAVLDTIQGRATSLGFDVP